MAAYIIFLRERLRDAEKLSAYVTKARAASAGHPLTIRVQHGRQEVLEGPDVETVSILEFPTYEDAKRWYDSPAYREALPLRLAAGDYRAIIVEGLP